MRRDMPHSGMGDGTKVFNTAEDPAKLRRMLREEQEKDAPPPLPRLQKNVKTQAEQQKRLENQWAVGLTGGTYGMHTRHVTTAPPAFASDDAKKKTPPAPLFGTSVEKGPPSPPKSRPPNSSVMVGGQFNVTTTYRYCACPRHEAYATARTASRAAGRTAGLAAKHPPRRRPRRRLVRLSRYPSLSAASRHTRVHHSG
jgi:hypothetical protein